jgi:hypothetical protein
MTVGTTIRSMWFILAATASSVPLAQGTGATASPEADTGARTTVTEPEAGSSNADVMAPGGAGAEVPRGAGDRSSGSSTGNAPPGSSAAGDPGKGANKAAASQSSSSSSGENRKKDARHKGSATDRPDAKSDAPGNRDAASGAAQ